MDKPSESAAKPGAQTGAGQAAEQSSAQSSAQDSQQSPGALLAAAREANELTVDEVGDALNLAPTTVRYLEADNYERLPAAAFTQGYIRNYAKHVGLDADMIVSAYQNKAGKPDVEWESPRTAAGIVELVQRYPGALISAVVAAVVLLIVLTVIVVWPEDDPTPIATDPSSVEQEGYIVAGDVEEDSTSAPGAAVANKSAAGSGSSRSSAGAASGTGSDNTSARRYDAPLAAGATSGDGFDRDAIDPNDPLAHLPLAKTYPAGSADTSLSSTIDTTPSQTGTYDDSNYPLTLTRRLTPQGDDEVRVEVSEDSWVAISSAAGDSLFGMLARPGQTLNLTGAGPFRVKLGYAPGVELFFNDEPVLIGPYTRNDVASLVIGQ